MQTYARTLGAEVGPRALSARRATAPATDPSQMFDAWPGAGRLAPMLQSTLAREAVFSGRGLHRNRWAEIRVAPAPAGHGITIRREGAGTIRADWRLRVRQPLCTALAFPDGSIARTVEHPLAALSGLGIDNAAITMVGEEFPIFDGSAAAWCAGLLEAGLVHLAEPRRFLKVTREVCHEVEGRMIRIAPASTLSLDVRIALKGFGPMRWQGEVTPRIFVDEIAPSRSFGRIKWALPTKLFGLATGRPILRGATFGTTAAIWGGRIVGGMRVPNEPVRHRALDLVGDLSLAGSPILGHVTAINPGHEVNHAVLARLMTDRDAWEYVEA